jgi:hypothetical protein
MRKIFPCSMMLFISAGFFLTQQATPQSPEKMSFQAVVRSADNNLVTSAPVGMKISILQGSATGTPVYVETQTPVTNINGLVTLEIGEGVSSDNFSAIDWSSGPYFIKTETDPAGGTNYTISGTGQILSVPYALYAKNAGDGFSGNYSDLADLPDLSHMVEVENPQEGDLAYYSSGHWVRFPKGSEGQILTVNNGKPAWITYGYTGIQSYFQFVTYKSGTSVPVAFGFIYADGTISSGSGNFTCIWNSTYLRYEIAINGESYFWTNYSTLATLTSHISATGAILQVGSEGGKLLIYISRLSPLP